MYSTYFVVAALLVVAWLLVLYKPRATEGFATVAVHPTLVPDCVARSTTAQSLLARMSSATGDDAEEFRLLVAKLCCLEADISAPYATGAMRTQQMQFRTSQDMEPATAFVGRCLRGAVTQRDIDLAIEKLEGRGSTLLKQLGCDADSEKEFADVVASTRLAMVNFCLKPQPTMDRPTGPRDVGFWEPTNVADLSQYQGISAEPK